MWNLPRLFKVTLYLFIYTLPILVLFQLCKHFSPKHQTLHEKVHCQPGCIFIRRYLDVHHTLLLQAFVCRQLPQGCCVNVMQASEVSLEEEPNSICQRYRDEDWVQTLYVGHSFITHGYACYLSQMNSIILQLCDILTNPNSFEHRFSSSAARLACFTSERIPSITCQFGF